MLMLDIAVVNTALPAMAREFGAGMGALKWVVDGYTLPLAALVLTAGAWADRSGRRRVFVIGVLIFTVASACCAAAPSMTLLNGARVVQGAGAALLFATSLALLAAAYPGSRERTAALALYGATIGASFAVGPLLGGILTQWFDWRAIFLINVPAGIVMLAGARRVAESRSTVPRRGDWLGQVTVIVALAALTEGFFTAADHGWSHSRTLTFFAVAAAGLALFVLVERVIPEPMLPLAMFANRAFAGAQLATFAISASLFAVFVYVTLYLQGVVGLSPIGAGLVYLPGTVVMFLAAGLADRLMAWIPARWLITAGLVAVGAGLAWMTVAAVDGSAGALVPGFVVACLGAGVVNPVMSAVVLAESRGDDAGLAAGLNDVFRQSGIALGVAALGGVFPVRSVLAGGSPAAYVQALHVALWISCGVAVAGALIAAGTMREARVAVDDEPETAVRPARAVAAH